MIRSSRCPLVFSAAPGSSPLRKTRLSHLKYTPRKFTVVGRRYAVPSRYNQYPGRRRVWATARITRTSPRVHHATK